MPVAEVLRGRRRSIGEGVDVLRVLPAGHRQMVGPFIFLDQVGPANVPPGGGLDVRPHPHIGLATVTYLYEGALLHRDSLGCVQEIRPGDVNWMVAGRGIVHSERTPEGERSHGGPLLGLQCWVALPREREEMEPSFAHHAAATLPTLRRPGVELTLVAGEGFGLRSPVEVQSRLCHARLEMEAGASFLIGGEHEEIGIYCVDGAVEVDGQPLGNGELAVLEPRSAVALRAAGRARLFVIGGDRFPEPRLISWNFVASSEERIERARSDWRAYGRAPFERVPREDDWIPLPGG